MARENAEQRDILLKAAIKIFAERGLDGTTIRAVAAEAKVNSALIYYYFENKQTLFEESVKYILRGFFERLSENLRPFKSGRERLEYLVNCIFEYYCEFPERMHLMSVMIVMHLELMRKILRQFLKERSALPLQIIADGVEVGQLKKTNPLQTWWIILGACMFTIKMRQVVEGKSFFPEKFVIPEIADARRQILETLESGLVLNR